MTLETRDSVHVEIRKSGREDSHFRLGRSADEAFDRKSRSHTPGVYDDSIAVLGNIIDCIAEEHFCDGDRELSKPIVDSLLKHDSHLLLTDDQTYVDCSQRAAETYRAAEGLSRMSILHVARCGFFSSNRSMRQCCDEIRRVNPLEVQ